MTDVLDKNLPGALGDKCWWDEEGEALVTREADPDGDYGVCSNYMASYRHHKADNPSVQRMLAATMPLVEGDIYLVREGADALVEQQRMVAREIANLIGRLTGLI